VCQVFFGQLNSETVDNVSTAAASARRKRAGKRVETDGHDPDAARHRPRPGRAVAASLRQAWPWLASAGGLCVALLITQPSPVEPAPDAAATRVQGWTHSDRTATAWPLAVAPFNYRGIEQPAPPRRHTAIAATVPTAPHRGTIDPVRTAAALRPAPKTVPLPLPEPPPKIIAMPAPVAFLPTIAPLPPAPPTHLMPPEPPWGLRALFINSPPIVDRLPVTMPPSAPAIEQPDPRVVVPVRPVARPAAVAAKSQRAPAPTPRPRKSAPAAAGDGPPLWRDQAFERSRG
jgi:hypothetical protein